MIATNKALMRKVHDARLIAAVPELRGRRGRSPRCKVSRSATWRGRMVVADELEEVFHPRNFVPCPLPPTPEVEPVRTGFRPGATLSDLCRVAANNFRRFVLNH